MRRARVLAGALALLLVALGAAGAQLALTQLNLAGQRVQGVLVNGIEYASASTLGNLLSIVQTGGVVRVTGFGHLLLLPIDEDNQRATTDFNTVQLDSERVKARTATVQDGKVLLPLDTLARGLGAEYSQGKFTFPPAKLGSVSSLAGRTSDRIVLDLNRNVQLREELLGGKLRLTLLGTAGSTQTYATRGGFVPRVQVRQSGDNLQVELPLTGQSGYRLYSVVRPEGVRLVLDVGPGISLNVPALINRVRRPVIVLDPASVAGRGGDVTLEVARSAAELLSKAGWQVQLTRSTAQQQNLGSRLLLARQSDVYVSLDLGRFPGASRSGVTLYQHVGRSSTQILNAYRDAGSAPDLSLVRSAVGDPAESRRLSDLLRGELKAGGLPASQRSVSRQVLLGEAPHAALLLELGWPSNDADQARLSSSEQNQKMAQALAHSIATYLAARINGGTS
ncbi:N-acetylmuramoyl-L-alanine amidase family protein [Deinococcus sonorensis]|uniref:N-acetylmuramoyl-L-alanine amidase n=2 Tax=Deinococcus sonorensis TaxID=309891 RepID=A0AAU7UAQ5_9DEIO